MDSTTSSTDGPYSQAAVDRMRDQWADHLPEQEPANCPKCGLRRQLNVDGEIVHAHLGNVECAGPVLILGSDQTRFYNGAYWMVRLPYVYVQQGAYDYGRVVFVRH